MQMHYQLIDNYLYVTFSGRMSSNDINNLQHEFNQIAEACREKSCRKIFFNIDTSVEDLGTMELFYSGISIADMPDAYKLKIAVCVPREQIKGEFFETVAVNRGANLRVFTEKREATSWLQGTL